MKYYTQECILTLDELKVLCDEWKVILGLENWDIRVDICKQYDIPPDSTGTCNAVSAMRTATIKLLDPIDWNCGPFEYNMEIVLVHELLHCSFDIIKQSLKESTARIVFEQNIELLANSLVGLKRDK